ncbi:hypothetical protein D9M72_571450 [compost metagenome]
MQQAAQRVEVQGHGPQFGQFVLREGDALIPVEFDPVQHGRAGVVELGVLLPKIGRAITRRNGLFGCHGRSFSDPRSPLLWTRGIFL